MNSCTNLMTNDKHCYNTCNYDCKRIQGSHKPGVGSEQETAVRGSRGGKAWDSYNIVCTVSNHVIHARALWEPALAFGTDCTIPDTLVFVMISDLIKWALAKYFNIY